MTDVAPSELGEVARLVGRLLLREVDAATLAELRAPELAEALAAVGLATPAPQPDEVATLGAEYFEAFVQPEHGGPPVQSLWTDGTYEGDAAVAVRKLAEAAALDYDRAAARGAPHDHIGSVLCLWAAARERAPEVAARLARDHMGWAQRPLGRQAHAGTGFYSDVARTACALIDELRAE